MSQYYQLVCSGNRLHGRLDLAELVLHPDGKLDYRRTYQEKIPIPADALPDNEPIEGAAVGWEGGGAPFFGEVTSVRKIGRPGDACESLWVFVCPKGCERLGMSETELRELLAGISPDARGKRVHDLALTLG